MKALIGPGNNGFPCSIDGPRVLATDACQTDECGKCTPVVSKRLTYLYLQIPVHRHVPGSQPHFSLIPDSDQNKEDTQFISVVAYGVYMPFHVRFNSVLYQTQISRKMPRSCRSCGTLDPGSECFFPDFHRIQIISSKKSPVI